VKRKSSISHFIRSNPAPVLFSLLILWRQRTSFLGAFAKLGKATVSFVMSVHRHGSTWLPLDGFSWEIWAFFENLSRKFKFHWNLTKITGTSHEDQCTCLIIYRPVLLRMRNVSNKSYREKHTFYFQYPSPRKSCRVGKKWYSRAGHRWQYGACVLGT
jgi:hypothetical protein